MQKRRRFFCGVLQNLHPCSHSRRGIDAAHSARPLMVENKSEGRETDEHIDEVLKPHPRAKKEIYDVPVSAHIAADSNETPVEATDDDEDERNTMH